MNCEVELGWTCGTGNFARPDLCFEICGDGRSLKSWSKMGNMCDDGNEYNGDGCDADCVLEYGYECVGGDLYTPDVCREVCGDGFNIGINACDDGNTKSKILFPKTIIDGDGCSSSCAVESGWTCAGGTPTVEDNCTEICGDGRVFGRYFCDDGNLVNGDGCNSLCNIENGYTCGGGNTTTRDFCWRPNPRIVDAKINSNNTVITLTFNESTFMSSTFTKDDIMVFISGPRDIYSYNIDILNLAYYRGSAAGFTDLAIQITYKDSGQFFGLNAEGIVVAIRDGTKFTNIRGGLLTESVWVMYGNPRESDYQCELGGLWEAAFWVIIIFFFANVAGYFME